MKLIPVKLQILTLFTLLLFPPLIQANEPFQETDGGMLHAIKHASGGNIKIQLDDTWYTIDKNCDFYFCGERTTEKSIADLSEFMEWYIIVPITSDEILTQIHVPCQ